MIMFTINVKMTFMAQVNFDNSNNITMIMAFMAKITINMKNNDDVTVQGDVIASNVIVIVWWYGDLTTLTTTEEEAAGLLLALPRSTTTIEKEEEEMPNTGSLLLDLPLQLLLQQQPFSQGISGVIIKFGKGGEGGKEEEKEEVPGHGGLLLLKDEKNERNVPGLWCTIHSHEKNRKKQ